MCHHNKLVAEKYGNSDTVQCWKLAHLIATSIATASDSLDDEIFMQQIPFPKILLESLCVHENIYLERSLQKELFKTMIVLLYI